MSDTDFNTFLQSLKLMTDQCLVSLSPYIPETVKPQIEALADRLIIQMMNDRQRNKIHNLFFALTTVRVATETLLQGCAAPASTVQNQGGVS
jgi:hypothetical protein